MDNLNTCPNYILFFDADPVTDLKKENRKTGDSILFYFQVMKRRLTPPACNNIRTKLHRRDIEETLGGRRDNYELSASTDIYCN